VAEELDADFASVRVVNASNGEKPGGGNVYGTPAGGGLIQLTGASTSTIGFWGRYRLVAAQARARLVAAAAEAREVPAEEVEVDSGKLSHPSGTRAARPPRHKEIRMSSTTNVTTIMPAERIYQRVYAS
jgi:isoquinoline 1-oxidoreductase subunit beta